MKKFQWKELLPWLGIPISAAYWLAADGAQAPFEALRGVAVLAIGFWIAWHDFRTKTIPNRGVLILLSAWAVVTATQLFLETDSAINALRDSLVGFALAGILGLLVYFISRKGLGGGDVKFMAVAGLYLGFDNTLPAMLVASVLAAAYGGVMILMKKMDKKDALPFSPFLYIGIVLTIFLQGVSR